MSAPLRPIFPNPTTLREGDGALELKGMVGISAPPEWRPEVGFLTSLLGRAGVRFAELESAQTRNRPSIVFEKLEPAVPAESYQIRVDREGVNVRAADAAGAFYAVQTVRQLLPVSFEGAGHVREAVLLPFLEIEDAPRFAWRGFMLDVSRHFFTAEEVKGLIDLMGLLKLNVFHWHLTDDGGWRLESQRFPELTRRGAWREQKPFLWDYKDISFPDATAGVPVYGGFYTREEAIDVVRYAAERHITVVPEIEIPAHSLAACWSYPETACRPEAIEWFTQDTGMRFANVFCAGKEETFTFLQAVLDEALEIFPSEYIHIGGDEADQRIWEHCEDCRQKTAELGIANTEGLQSHFIARIEEHLLSRGRKMIGWDEILAGGLAPHVTVMSWRGRKGGVLAAKAGHEVIMTPTSHCYFDYDYTITSTEDVLKYDPCENLNEAEAKMIKGGQANVWTEYIPDLPTLERQVFPRLTAMAEVLWVPNVDAEHFMRSLPSHLARLDALGVRFENSAYWASKPPPVCQTGVLTFE